MSDVLRQRNTRRAENVAVSVPRQHFLKTIACSVIDGLSRGKIRRANVNMDSLRSLLEEYLPIISPRDQAEILQGFDQYVFVAHHTIRYS